VKEVLLIAFIAFVIKTFSGALGILQISMGGSFLISGIIVGICYLIIEKYKKQKDSKNSEEEVSK
jgi:hypothetical protein